MKIKIFCTALLLFPAIAMAAVNTKNGNFYITYQEITQESGGHELNLNRTYNSKSSGIGWFGHGWGSTFETHIMVMPDGSVVAQEHGYGRENYYAPKDGSNLQAGVDKIVAVAIERDKLGSEAAEALRGKLLTNEDLRRSNVAKYDIQSQLPVGGVAQLNACNTITRVGDEYRRTSCGEQVDYFDLAGRLIRQEDRGYRVTLHYAGNYPHRIEDSLGQKLILMWTAAGRVAHVRTGNTKPQIGFYYDEKDNLLASNEYEGNIYRFEYDSNHNMTKIVYIDNTHMDMQYDERGLVTSVTETDGSKTHYAYRADPNNPSSHYSTTITRISATGEQSSREEEFLWVTDAVGVEKLASFKRNEGSKKQDVVLDDQGRVKRIQKSDGGFSEYFYHPALNKVSVVKTDKGDTFFQYDQAGNLVEAYNSDGRLIKLQYDSKKRISRMLETNKTKHMRQELTFKYNAQGKPVKIKMVGKGEINVEYDDEGNISKVESKQGAVIALAVAAAFQSLSSVVKVAGVDLKM